MFLPFLTDAPEVWLMVSETLHSVSHHDANAKPGTTTQGNRPKTLRRGRKGALEEENQDTTQGNRPETLRRGRKGTLEEENQDTTQGNRPETLRRGRKGAHVIQKTKIRSNDQSQNNGNFGEGIRIFLKGRARLFIFVPPKK